MPRKLTQSLICGGLGYFIGLSMGVAALGSAVSGAVVFGPLGLLIGWLLPTLAGNSAQPGSMDEVGDADGGSSTSPQHTTRQPDPSPSAPVGDMQRIEDTVGQIMPMVGKLAASVWNLQMKLLRSIGVMPYLVRQPWLLGGIGFALLAVAFPLGVVFSVTGMVAAHYGAVARDEFLIVID